GVTETAAIWLNRFTPPGGAYPIVLNQVHILWPDNGTGAIVGKSVRLLVYLDSDGDNNPSNALLLYQQFVTVGVTETFQTYNLTSPRTIAGPGDVCLGFEDFWAEPPGYSPRLFPAALDQTPPSLQRSWVVGMSTGAALDITNLGNNDTVGLTDAYGLPG